MYRAFVIQVSKNVVDWFLPEALGVSETEPECLKRSEICNDNISQIFSDIDISDTLEHLLVDDDGLNLSYDLITKPESEAQDDDKGEGGRLDRLVLIRLSWAGSHLESKCPPNPTLTTLPCLPSLPYLDYPTLTTLPAPTLMKASSIFLP